MQIHRITHIEDCFDGSLIKEVEFTAKISEELILHLGKNGDLQYYKNFTRPFFKVAFGSDFYLKGVLGNKTIRLFLNHKDNIEHFFKLFNKEVSMD